MKPRASIYAAVENSPPSETARVAMKVGGLDMLEDGGAVVFFGHFSPPIEIALELLRESDGARPGFGRGDHVVEFSKVEPYHWNDELQELCFFLPGMRGP